MDIDRLPSFYTVIPSFVRYSRDLGDFDKLLYGEIVALTNLSGVSWATNAYYMMVFDKSADVISRSIKKLFDLGFIDVKIKAEEGNKRYIYLTTPIRENADTPIRENADTLAFSKEKALINNTSMNIKAIPNNFNQKKQKSYSPDVKIDWLDDYIKSIK